MVSMCIIYCAHKTENPVLIGSTPIIKKNKQASIALSDHLNASLSNLPQKYVLLTADHLLDTADRDSVFHKAFWLHYANRLKLDYLILSYSESNLGIDSLSVECWKMNPEKHLLFSHTNSVQEFDSLLFTSIQDIHGLFYGSKLLKCKLFLPPLDQSDYWQGRYYAMFDSMSLAIDYYNLALQQLPDYSSILLSKGNALVNIGQRLQSRKKNAQAFFLEAESVLASIPDSSEFRLKREMIRAHLNVCQASWNRAEAAIRAIMLIDPNQSSLYLFMSRLHPTRFKKFGFSNRKQLYEKALMLNPAYEMAYLALGDWYYFNNKIETAESVYKQLLDIYPQSIDGLMALGKLYLYRNESLKLIHIYEQVYKLSSQNPDILYNLAIAYYNGHDFQKALELFKKAASVYNYADAYYYLGVIYMKKEDFDQALEAFRKRIYLRTSSEDTYANEAVNHVYQIRQQQMQKSNTKDDA